MPKDEQLVQVVLRSLRHHPPPQAKTNTEYTASNLQLHNLARLWAGMGYIYRVVTTTTAEDENDVRVVKHVRLPRGKNISRGDQRKADSYHCESNFYEHVAPSLRQQAVGLPETYYVERTPEAIFIVMSYIDGRSNAHLNPTRTKLVLDWLARFHAASWGKRRENNHSSLLQSMGTYWHLDTRPDEHASMSNKGWEGRLKLAARAIHERLQNDPCQSLVHGDVKEANIMFVPNEESSSDDVVLCDFQYCGRGTPAQDLAYFFCSSIDDLEDRQDEYLEYYVEQLTSYLPTNASTIPTLADMKDSLDWAYCDFLRFMMGWGSWGNDLTEVVKAKLHTLDGGKSLGSEDAYCAAMQKMSLP